MRLRRVLRGFVLTCGCVGGSYERYDDRVVDIIDDKSIRCRRPDHRPGALVHHDELHATSMSPFGSSTEWQQDRRH
jgi:hypothetical protein